jgi:uncharacterized damage-inducible protein DinB
MDARLAPLAALFDLNTDLALNCLEGIDDQAARLQAAPALNSMAFLLAHITDSRHYLAAWLRQPIDNPLAAALKDATGISDAGPLPDLDTLRREWKRISAHLGVALAATPPEVLNESSPQRFPIADDSRLGAIAFLAQHESYHIGQLGLLRRQAGREAMGYARRRASSPAARTPPPPSDP